jgi:hypothetical protein
MQTGDHGGPIFVYPFSATALTTNPQDLWCVTAPSNSRLAVREIRFGQYSDPGDAQAEMLSITFMSGSTAGSTGAGTAITGLNINRYSTAVVPAASATVNGPSTSLSSTASATVIFADTFNVMGGFRYYPVPAERYIIGMSQRFVVRMTAPNDALTVNGTLMLQEIGQTPQ